MKHQTKSQEFVDEVVYETENDFRSALLVISLVVNLFILTTWLVLETTDRYDSAMISFLLNM